MSNGKDAGEAPVPLTGADLIRSQLPHLPHGPGVYRMLGADQEVLSIR